MLAEWLREWDQHRVERAEKRGLEEGLEKGREQAREERRLCQAWYERQQAAFKEGRPFTEPPPFATKPSTHL